jgi:hypothetical protein
MQNKNTIEMLKMEFLTFRTFLSGAMEKAQSIHEILNEMNEQSDTPVKEKMLDFVNDFLDENSSEIEDDLQENVFEIEIKTKEYDNEVTITAEKGFSTYDLDRILKTTLQKFVDDYFYHQEQEKGSNNE